MGHKLNSIWCLSTIQDPTTQLTHPIVGKRGGSSVMVGMNDVEGEM